MQKKLKMQFKAQNRLYVLLGLEAWKCFSKWKKKKKCFSNWYEGVEGLFCEINKYLARVNLFWRGLWLL